MKGSDINVDKSEQLAILVYSCWNNSGMWNVFLRLLKKYWSDCKYKLILLTDRCEKEHSEYDFDLIVEIDSSWEKMIKRGIEVASTPYVMLWMDDYLLCDYVKNEDIEYYLRCAKDYNAANIRFLESLSIKANTFPKDDNFNYYEQGTAYAMSTQVGIWRASFLTKHIKENWSAWDFERRGSIEIRDYEHPLLAPKNYTFPYEEGVRKGKWMIGGVNLCKRNGIDVAVTGKPIMSSLEMAWIYFKGAILEWNPTLIVKIQNILKK